MTDAVPAGGNRAAQAPSAPAAELAAHIPIPKRLPERYDGEPLRHLSPSSYALWATCPEAWRRRYIKGVKPVPTGSMFVGGRVDDALSAYYRRLLENGDRLALDQMFDMYRHHWVEALEVERDKQGIDWEQELSDSAAFNLGREAIGLAMAELVPHLGEPVDVQRRIEFSLAPALEWTVLCYLDLETLKDDSDRGPAPTVVDFKVKGSLISSEQADRDPQAGLYLAGRWLEGYPANELVFAQIAKPGKRRKQMSASLVSTGRSAGEMRGVLARIALAASQIAACHERYGPDQPWGLADPTSWKCSPRYCHHWGAARADAAYRHKGQRGLTKEERVPRGASAGGVGYTGIHRGVNRGCGGRRDPLLRTTFTPARGEHRVSSLPSGGRTAAHAPLGDRLVAQASRPTLALTCGAASPSNRYLKPRLEKESHEQ